MVDANLVLDVLVLQIHFRLVFICIQVKCFTKEKKETISNWKWCLNAHDWKDGSLQASRVWSNCTFLFQIKGHFYVNSKYSLFQSVSRYFAPARFESCTLHCDAAYLWIFLCDFSGLCLLAPKHTKARRWALASLAATTTSTANKVHVSKNWLNAKRQLRLSEVTKANGLKLKMFLRMRRFFWGC